ncbi:acyltransferase-domain-containing protein [Fimicolochytrium jonesii]|uniref:acyltransferase-domain-containing protein n=1 Tax=Fimicolochytrium jonesii TaxID=1396493 RepID=UPI0022FE4164|nr:acyltransferase-domain-containing protein [Fimicolochytrium jonesii]KAI8824355.1 acyltransferase-domain-containing protein [Fimicolochytrium jonesii]
MPSSTGPHKEGVQGDAESAVLSELPQSEPTTGTPEMSESTNVAGTGVGRFRSDPLGFMLRLTSESSAFYTGTGWRAYQNYIGARIFYEKYSDEIRTGLLTSDSLADAVKAVSLARYRQLHSSYASKDKLAKKTRGPRRDITLEEVMADTQRRLVRMMDGMVASMSSIRTIRFVAFFINSMLVRMYQQGIHIRENEFVELQKVARYAEKNRISLIFLPSHKSHVDYLVLSYIFYRLGIALPHIAAGDNLNMPVVGQILKAGGAFFIRRQWGDDMLYGALMREYIELLMQRGHNIEVFIEGTRSRIGKVLQPKFGILKIMLDAVASGRVKDAIMVPMSIGYDKVIETESYVNELLGTPKEKESLSQLFGNLNILQFKLGRIDIRFAKPYSLMDYIKSQEVRRGSEFHPLTVPKDRTLLLQSLGFRILSDINAASVIMPTALVGTVVLTLRGRGVGRDELIRKVNWLKREILTKSGRVAHFGDMSTAAIVERAVQQMRDLIGQRTDLLEPVYYPLKRFELSFYRNQVIHLFLAESILSMAMYATVKNGGPVHSQRIMLRPSLAEDVSFVSQLLKAEFIYGPGGLDRNLEDTVSKLHAANVISIEEERLGTSESGADVAHWISLSPEERRLGRETFDFYCFLIWPFIETYWLAAVSLFAIIPENPPAIDNKTPTLEWVDERVFMNRAQYLGKTLYYEGDLSYFESINKETIKNALARFKDMGVVLTHKSPLPPSKTAPYLDVSMLPPKRDPRLPVPSGTVPAPPPQPASGTSITWIAIAPEYIPRDRLPPTIVAFQARAAAEAASILESDKATVNASAVDLFQAGTVAAVPAFPTSKLRRPRDRRPGQVPSGTSAIPEVQNTASAATYPLTPPPEEDIQDPWSDIHPESALWDFCEHIGRFRREGKNRRDTATVAIRVLRLARLAAFSIDRIKGKSKGKVKKPADPPAAMYYGGETAAASSSRPKL